MAGEVGRGASESFTHALGGRAAALAQHYLLGRAGLRAVQRAPHRRRFRNAPSERRYFARWREP